MGKGSHTTLGGNSSAIITIRIKLIDVTIVAKKVFYFRARIEP